MSFRVQWAGVVIEVNRIPIQTGGIPPSTRLCLRYYISAHVSVRGHGSPVLSIPQLRHVYERNVQV